MQTERRLWCVSDYTNNRTSTIMLHRRPRCQTSAEYWFNSGFWLLQIKSLKMWRLMTWAETRGLVRCKDHSAPLDAIGSPDVGYVRGVSSRQAMCNGLQTLSTLSMTMENVLEQYNCIWNSICSDCIKSRMIECRLSSIWWDDMTPMTHKFVKTVLHLGL